MKVNIGRLRRMEGESADLSVEQVFKPFRFGAEELTFALPVRLQVHVINTGRALVAQGRIQTSINVPCSRCLEDFVYPIDLPYEDEWVFKPDATPEQQENALLFEQDEIDLEERVFEQIVVGLPMKFTCSPDCRGLCTQCGKNLNSEQCNCADNNVDPRLADLAKWLEK